MPQSSEHKCSCRGRRVATLGFLSNHFTGKLLANVGKISLKQIGVEIVCSFWHIFKYWGHGARWKTEEYAVVRAVGKL